MTTYTQVDFHFDPMCPFAYHTSRWIREVRAHTGLTVNWRFFSLEEVNRFEGKKHPWQRPWSYGWSQLRVAALLRRRDPALLDAWYARIGRELHLDAGKPHDPETARQLLTEIGAGAALLDEALADPSTHEDIKADHQRVLDAGGFGVPTLFFPDGQCLFGPVLVDPPSGAAAVRLWDVVTGMLEFPHVYEVQRPKAARDERAIADALAPYLQGRDWKSVDRGQIIELGDERESTS